MDLPASCGLAETSQPGSDQRRRDETRSAPARLEQTGRNPPPPTHPDNHHTSFSGGRGFFSRPLASRLVGPIALFPGRPPLDRPMVGGATPTPLGEVPSGGVRGSAHLLTFGHVRNGDGAESGETPTPCRLAKEGRHAYVRLRPCAHLLASARRMPRVECCRVKVKMQTRNR